MIFKITIYLSDEIYIYNEFLLISFVYIYIYITFRRLRDVFILFFPRKKIRVLRFIRGKKSRYEFSFIRKSSRILYVLRAPMPQCAVHCSTVRLCARIYIFFFSFINFHLYRNSLYA